MTQSNSKIFSQDDQDCFASLSGDFNPVHLDRIFARRTIFGAQIIHGVNGLLAGLNFWVSELKTEIKITHLKAKFYKPIKLNQEVIFSYKFDQAKDIDLTLSCNGTIMTKLKISYVKQESTSNHQFINSLPPKSAPLDPTNDEISQIQGSLDPFLAKEKILDSFPYLDKFIDSNQISVILASTRLVGMICPGLYSIFSELHIKIDQAKTSKHLTYQVNRFDERFGLADLEMSGLGQIGRIIAFVRPKKRDQISMNGARQLIASNELIGHKAIIIGGSRGLGEVVAKLISAAGGSARITYSQGKQDAIKVCNEINEAGGDADCFELNVLDKAFDISSSLKNFIPNHVYYFATPLIPQTQNQIFNHEVYNELYNFYILGFLNIYEIFKESAKNYFYPSTSFINDQPQLFLEYIEAKKKAEEVLEALQLNQNINIYKPRLPQMATDQTASLSSSEPNDPAPILLNYLKIFTKQTKIK